MSYTATYAGMVTVGILALLLTPIVCKMLATRDRRQIATVAFIIFALVCFMRSGVNTQTDMRTLIVPTIIQGAAMAMFFVPLTSTTLSSLDPSRISAASGLSNFSQLTACALGTSIATTVWENRATLHHAQFTELATPGQPAFDRALSTLQNGVGLTEHQSLTVLDGLINTQAFTLSALDVFYASAGIFILLIGAVWFAHPELAQSARSTEAAAGAH